MKELNKKRYDSIMVKHYYNNIMDFLGNYGRNPNLEDKVYEKHKILYFMNLGIKDPLPDSNWNDLKKILRKRFKQLKLPVLTDWTTKITCTTDIILMMHIWYVHNEIVNMKDDKVFLLNHKTLLTCLDNEKNINLNNQHGYFVNRWNLNTIGKSLFDDNINERENINIEEFLNIHINEEEEVEPEEEEETIALTNRTIDNADNTFHVSLLINEKLLNMVKQSTGENTTTVYLENEIKKLQKLKSNRKITTEAEGGKGSYVVETKTTAILNNVSYEF